MEQQPSRPPLLLSLKSPPFLPPSPSPDLDFPPHPHSFPFPSLFRLAISPSPPGYASASTTFADLRAPSQTMSTVEDAYATAVKTFPERPNEPDCVYYIRTGQCAFGLDCKFNHPPDRNLIATLGNNKAGYPERIGQPECQYYMKTGNCKFGSTCKFHHPRERLGMLSTNLLGFPLRQGEKDCAYYMRTGTCKFGATCKFNHPQPAALMTVPGSSIYPSNTTPGAPSPQPFPAGMPSWPLPRAQFMPRSRFQNTANFTPLIVQHQNMVSVSGWNPYQGQLRPVASLESQPLGRTNLMYGSTSVNEASPSRIQTAYNAYASGSTTAGIPSTTQSALTTKEIIFPERPGQLNCQFYMKTGNCKFGMTCRFNHPKDRLSLLPHCILSPLGFPIRQGAPPCAFYMQHGTCKFGSTCKFDHPMADITYNTSTSSVTDIQTSPFPMGMSVAMVPSTNNGSRMMYHKIVSNGDIDKQQIYDNSYLITIGEENSDVQSGAGSSNILSSARSLEMGVHESGEDLNTS